MTAMIFKRTGACQKVGGISARDAAALHGNEGRRVSDVCGRTKEGGKEQQKGGSQKDYEDGEDLRCPGEAD